MKVVRRARLQPSSPQLATSFNLHFPRGPSPTTTEPLREAGRNITLTDGVNKGPSGGTVTADFKGSFLFNGTNVDYTHHRTVAQLTSIEDATGSRYSDELNGNSGSNVLNGGGGADVINGGAGADWITGGNGKDVLTGGTEGDTFVFDGRVSSSQTATLIEPFDPAANLSLADVIMDFEQGLDKIDLRGIDAIFFFGGPAGEDQAFTFIGTSQFTGHAGELHEIFLGGTTHAVQGDVNGDGTADFSILVQGLGPQAHIDINDFWL